MKTLDGWSIETTTRSGTRLVIATAPQGATADLHRTARMLADTHLPDTGAILFRGLGVRDATMFDDVVASFGAASLSYDFASTPRSHVGRKVYTSTEYPPHQWIPQHSEQSYTLSWPGRIWFFCETPSETGGETPIADARAVYSRISTSTRDCFRERKLMYVRNYGNGLDLDWNDVFQTDDRAVVEGYCDANAISYEWRDDGTLRTRQVCQSELVHPVTGEKAWFNQAHLFHVSNLEPATREALLSLVDEDELPRNVFFGDGSPIDPALLDEIRDAFRVETLAAPWQQGDVMLLDNMMVSHGRAPFTGRRRVLVAMTTPYNAAALPT